MVLGGVSDQVPVFDQPIRKKDAQAMFAVKYVRTIIF